jgi:transposase, IS5 family
MYTGLIEQLDFGNHLINEIVPGKHDLVKLKKILNWEKMNDIYKECYKSKKGNATKNTNLVLGLFILKHLYNKPYRKIIDELHVNTSYMYFCSVSYEEIKDLNKKDEKIICHSALVKIKNRIGADRFRRIMMVFIDQLKEKKIIDGSYLFSDTTSLENHILYPTDVSLLKRVIEEAEIIIQKLRLKKDLTKSETIKKANAMAKVYYSSSRKTKELAKSVCKDLISVAEDSLKEAARITQLKTMQNKKYIKDRFQKLSNVGQRIIEQTKLNISDEKIDDRIVSYYEDHARSLPKGKIGKPLEFGCKFRIDMSRNGYVTNCKLYKGNPSDALMLEESINAHHEKFKQTFKAAAFDRGFYDEQKITECEDIYNIKLAIPHKKDRTRKLGRHKEKIYNKRSAIEAKISEGKRMYGLGKSQYRGFEGDEIWSIMCVMSLNMKKLLRDIEIKPSILNKF